MKKKAFLVYAEDGVWGVDDLILTLNERLADRFLNEGGWTLDGKDIGVVLEICKEEAKKLLGFSPQKNKIYEIHFNVAQIWERVDET